jgi:ribose transport system substrate-binding protein
MVPGGAGRVSRGAGSVGERNGWPGKLAVDLSVSVGSGLILAAVAAALSLSGVGPGTTVPLWVLFPVAVAVGWATAVLVRRAHRRPEQVFLVIATRTGTTFLTQLLEHLTRVLEYHGIDLVVRMPRHDHSGRSQRDEFASLVRRRRDFIGGFVVPDQPEALGAELTRFVLSLGRPVVFLDRRPFDDRARYPSGARFVGSSPAAIGELAADWIAKELADRKIDNPHVLVVGGDGQAGREAQFEARLRERLAGARIAVDSTGQFDRDRAREIVASHLERMRRRGTTVDAVFCTNDEMALGAADAVRAHSGPMDADAEPVVVGVDGNAHAVAAIRTGASPLRATVVQDPRHVAEVAVDHLLALRAGQQVALETFTANMIYPSP